MLGTEYSFNTSNAHIQKIGVIWGRLGELGLRRVHFTAACDCFPDAARVGETEAKIRAQPPQCEHQSLVRIANCSKNLNAALILTFAETACQQWVVRHCRRCIWHTRE